MSIKISFWNVATFAVFCLTLLSCTSFSLYDANRLQKGMSVQTVSDLVSKSPKNTYTIHLKSEPNATLTVMSFDMKSGGTTSDYFAVFENDQLLYWGYPYEFNRYPDPRMNEIGKAAVETMP